MSNEFLIHLTGTCALVLNVLAIVRTCERRLRIQSGVAGLVWALNNLLLDAHSAAALSLVSAGRTASSAATLQADAARRRLAFVAFAALTLVACALTWQGWLSALLLTASLLSTYSMFYMRGPALRWVMLLVSMLWMINAWSYGSWEQVAANAVTGAAAVYAASRAGRASIA